MVEEAKHIEQHQDYLLVAKTEIEGVAQQVFDLQTRLKQSHQTLAKLVADYQQERYKIQEEIWRQRDLIRCTGCYEVPPDPEKKTQGWGLMKPESAHFVSHSYTSWHHYHENDSRDTHLIFDRFCNSCYLNTIKERAHGGGGLNELKPETVDEINQIFAASYEYEYERRRVLRKRFGFYDYIRVRWCELPIPEGAYEIGEAINLKSLTSRFSLQSNLYFSTL